MSVLDYILKYSEIAKELAKDGPVTLEELFVSYCETQERFETTCKLLEKLVVFHNEKLKLSNCVLDETLPYDSLIGLSSEELEELRNLADYLCLPKRLIRKLTCVIQNLTNYNEYYICTTHFNKYNINHWIRIGDIRGLKWCYKESGEWNESTCAEAALSGELECLIWLREHGCPWTEEICAGGAIMGQLNCPKCACILDGNRFKGCPWNMESCKQPAIHGHLECLKYIGVLN